MFNVELNKHLIEYTINKFGIDEYFPHPRDPYKLQNVNSVQTDLVFEDYLMEEVAKGYDLEVYTYFSTAALNVAHFGDNVKVFSLFPKNRCRNDVKQIYDIFKNEGVPIIEFEVV